MTKIHTHYDNLKIGRNAPASVVKVAYKALSQIYHPDKFKGCKKEAERTRKLSMLHIWYYLTQFSVNLMMFGLKAKNPK